MSDIDPQTLMSGTWKFHSNITEDKVVELAKSFAFGTDGEHYLDLHVKVGSDKKVSLGFKYHLKNPGKAAHEMHFYKMQQIIGDQIGDRNVSGWNITTPTIIIKHVAI